MKLTDIIPRILIPLIKQSAKTDWYEATTNLEDPSRFDIDVEKMKLSPFFTLGVQANGRDATWWWTATQLYRHGLKVMRPTVEQCEALQHCDIRIGMDNYRQPFPVVVIELPEEYRRSISNEFAVAPSVCIAHLMTMADGKQMALVGSPFPHGAAPDKDYPNSKDGIAEEVFYLFHDNGVPIEDKLNIKVVNNEVVSAGKVMDTALLKKLGYNSSKEYLDQFALNQLVARITMNLCLAATYYGATRPAPANPDYYRKRQEYLKKNPSEGNELGLKEIPRYFTICQDVVIRERKEPSEYLGGTHASPKPHWRRGHWRMALVGKGRAEKKLVFVRPVFVRADIFAGNLAATKAEYTIK